MKINIVLLLLLLGISINSYSQIIENLGVINSNDYYYSNSYLQSTQTTFIYEFTVSGTRGIHFDFCSSKGITGTRVWLLDKNTNSNEEITEKCSNNGLVSSALNLSGIYRLMIDVVGQQSKWDFSINLYSSLAISKRTDKPIELGTLYRNREGWYIENSTMDFTPDMGTGGAIRYKFRTLCPTQIDYSTDASRFIIKNTDGLIVKSFISSNNGGTGGQFTLDEGIYILSLDYKDGHEDNLPIEFYITLLEDINLGSDSHLTSFDPVKSPLTRLPGDYN